MPGEPIDEYSVKLNFDAQEAVEGAIDATSEMEQALQGVVDRARELGDVDLGDELLRSAIEFFDTLEDGSAEMIAFSNMVNEVAAAGTDMEAAYVAVAEAFQDVNSGFREMAELEVVQQQEELNDLLETSVGILEDVKDAYEEQGRAIPIEKLKSLAERMQNVIDIGQAMGLTSDQIKARLIELGKEALPPVQGIRNIFKDMADNVLRRFGVSLDDVMGKLRTGLNVANSLLGRFGIQLTATAGALTAVAAAAGLVVVAVIQFVKWAKEGLAIALRNEEAHQRLALAVRQHQRALGELSPTQEEAVQFAAQLADTFNTTRIEMESLVATALFMTRQFELTTDQTLELAEAAAILGTAAGVNAESALRSITNFMLTGYTQGLQQLGIHLDEGTLFAKAYQMGLVELTGELDDNAKALAGLAIIQEEANKQSGDAIAASDTYAKSIEESRARSEEAKEEFGNLFEPLAAVWERIKSAVVISIIQGFMDIAAWATRTAGDVKALTDTFTEFFDEVARRFMSLDVSGINQLVSDPIGFFTGLLEENREAQREITDDIIKNWDDIGDDIEDSTGRVGESMEELEIRIINAGRLIRKEMDKLEENFRTRLGQIEQRFRDAMAKIDVDFGRRRTDAAADFTRDIHDIDEDARQSQIDAVRSHNEDVFRLEEDHKLRMIMLEERFLFELEDAVRERDARGVLMAQRRHNQEKKDAERQKGLREKQLKEDFVKELAEIERERIRRREERFQEFLEEQDDLALQEARRREDARTAREIAERDLRIARDRKMTLLAQGFLDEFKLTNSSLLQLFELTNAFLGPGGSIESLYEYIAAVAAQTNLSLDASLLSQNLDFGNTIPIVSLTGDPGRSFQRGGTFFATSPQMIRVGEVPEEINITPMSRAGGPSGGFGGGGGRSDMVDISLDVGMEDGLMAEIADQTMGQIANVVVNMTRKQKQSTRR